MSQVNSECATYIAGTFEFPIDVSPILISAEELSPGDVSITRTERQDFAVWVCDNGPNGERGLGSVYPPVAGHKIRLRSGATFVVTSMGQDEPPYVHVTSERERIIIHTVQVKR